MLTFAWQHCFNVAFNFVFFISTIRKIRHTSESNGKQILKMAFTKLTTSKHMHTHTHTHRNGSYDTVKRKKEKRFMSISYFLFFFRFFECIKDVICRHIHDAHTHIHTYVKCSELTS